MNASATSSGRTRAAAAILYSLTDVAQKQWHLAVPRNRDRRALPFDSLDCSEATDPGLFLPLRKLYNTSVTTTDAPASFSSRNIKNCWRRVVPCSRFVRYASKAGARQVAPSLVSSPPPPPHRRAWSSPLYAYATYCVHPRVPLFAWRVAEVLPRLHKPGEKSENDRDLKKEE